jgi:phosphate:Na+ symporter
VAETTPDQETPMAGQILLIAFELAGALALFMFGMQLSSDGFQRAAGDRLQHTVNLMTKNSVIAVFTGVLVTVLVQSSSATTVMVVSFVNAGLLTLFQAIGVIMGANIGTTLTGWIVAAVGVKKFSIVALAVPLFGVGYFLSLIKDKKKGEVFKGYGEGIMGFALIFLGLEFMAKAIPDPSAEALLFLKDFADKGWIAILACVAVGVVFTMLINASSATIAIVIGLAAKGVINFEMAAAITLGANIGTTFDSFLVSLGANVNAKRAAWAHILFNVIGTVWVIIAFKPFIAMVDWITPGAITTETAGAHIAMMHTLFNTANTIVLLPFVKQYAALVTKLIAEKPGAEQAMPKSYTAPELLLSPELNIVRARKEIGDLAELAGGMFSRFRETATVPKTDRAAETAYTRAGEEYADAVQDGLIRYLLEIAQQDINERTRQNIAVMLRVVNELESVTDGCFSLALILERVERKDLKLDKDELKNLAPYALLVDDFLRFVRAKIGLPLGDDELATAADFENRIDGYRDELKRLARKRLKTGAEVRSELLFIDLVRHIEKIGDNAFTIAEALREMK